MPVGDGGSATIGGIATFVDIEPGVTWYVADDGTIISGTNCSGTSDEVGVSGRGRWSSWIVVGKRHSAMGNCSNQYSPVES